MIDKHANGLCECGESETVGHVLFSCKLYSWHWQKSFVDLSELDLVCPVEGSITPYGVQPARILEEEEENTHGRKCILRMRESSLHVRHAAWLKRQASS